MSNAILVIGESGTGKSTSVETLPAEKTFIVNCIGKDLPFKGWRAKFKPFDKEGNGNYLATDNVGIIMKTLDFVNEKRKDIEYIIVDDFVYTMSNEFMRRAQEKSFDKFTDIGQRTWMLVDKAKSLRDNLNVAFLTHSEEFVDASGVRKQKVRTVGKLIDEKVNLEGMFTIVLYTNILNQGGKLDYRFMTNNNGYNTCKSPKGMFEEQYVPNDLKFVFEKINEYYFS